MMVDALIVPCNTNLADYLTTFGSIGGWDLVFREDGFKGAFWDACTTVDTGIGVDIKPWVLFKRLATHNTFHRAYINTSRITQAQTCNNMGHDWFLLLESIEFRLILSLREEYRLLYGKIVFRHPPFVKHKLLRKHRQGFPKKQ
jgi:hypothetical protein